MNAIPGPFESAWQRYKAAGYAGTLPLPARKSAPPPSGFTGATGVDPSGADIFEWLADPRYRVANLALRLPVGLFAFDVDSHPKGGRVKRGAEEMAAEEGRLGALPLTYYASNRGPDSASRHLLYRIAHGVYLDEHTKDEHGRERLPSVEFIQREFRYLLAPPSIHPSGRLCEWYRPDGSLLGVPPPLDGIPWLPDAWGEAYAVRHAVAAGVTDTEVRQLLDSFEPGPPCARVRGVLDRVLATLSAPQAARHPTAVPGVLALMRCGEAGHLGAREALETLRGGYVAAVTVPGANQRTAEVARREFDRMITNRRGVGLLLADPTPDDLRACACPEGIARLLATIDDPAYRAEIAALLGVSP